MELKPRETVILASDFTLLVNWYRDVLGFQVTQLFEDGIHYCNLETESGIRIGIGLAEETGVVPGERSSNTLRLQFEVTDAQAFFQYVEQHGGSIRFGPSFNEKDGFWFGECADPEGNPFWVVDEKCP